MSDYRNSPVRSKKYESSKKFVKEYIMIQKPKSKSRITSPESIAKSLPNSNKNSQSNTNISIQGQVLDTKFLEPKYRDLLAKYLASNSRQNSPQDPKVSARNKSEKKSIHKRVSSGISSPHIADPLKLACLDLNTGSQEKTLKNEQKRHSSLDPKNPNSNSQKSLVKSSSSDFDSSKKDHEDNRKKEQILQCIIGSIKIGSMVPTNSSFYLIGKQLGKGAFGKVYLGLHRLTGLKVAIKAIDKSIIQDERTRRKVFQEVYVMKKISHPNVIRLLEVFESNRHLMIVLEYAGGGDLLQFVKSRGNLTESEGKNIFSQVVDAIKACHDKNIIHRDVKLDNLLLTTDFTCIKLCDFGVSRSVKPGEKIFDQCGTPAYLAPEIIADRGYDPFYVDLWSMGVLLFAILTGTVPFRAKTLPELHKLILRCKYEMPEVLSVSAQDLIRKMLNPIPHLRIALDEIQNHVWFKENFEECHESFVEDSIAPRFLGGFYTSFRKPNEKEILAKIKSMGIPMEFVCQSLKLRDINHITATYYLLEVSNWM